MAEIVLVHGIGQQQEGSDALESEWRMDIASAVRKCVPERPEDCRTLADLLIRRADHQGAPDMRMAYYGDLFLDDGAQGAERDSTDDDALFEALAMELLTRAAARPGPDADAARVALLDLTPQVGDQGVATARLVQYLTRVRWLAPGVFRAAAWIKSDLRQVTAYLTKDDVRRHARNQVTDLVGPETVVVVGHSLGSVVAYEALTLDTVHTVPLFVTIGSPLGLDTIVQRHLQTRSFPNVHKWLNVTAPDDVVAAEPDLLRGLASDALGRLEFATVGNGSHPHSARHYLTKKTIGRAVFDALDAAGLVT